jgi:hypothetical protein
LTKYWREIRPGGSDVEQRLIKMAVEYSRPARRAVESVNRRYDLSLHFTPLRIG